ncbi:response regulator [Salinisphaera sp. P385]|uniref:Response regulator n=1 Tax=Spectribacter acetivorans TaxID=3075603 RepID=A0ABU3B925_9GAMM|nr:response regulator [Salinisphaera sp. P385]MDT0617476.1 response regulator [Salinisphaera sp. P385]
MRLLIVEDEDRLVATLKTRLARDGFAVDAVTGVGEADSALEDFPYDAAIIDLGLPDGDGLELIRGLRRRGDAIPTLVLTARDAVANRVDGLDAGADDYLIKPFAMSELVARIKALLRRPGGALGTVLTAGNLALDTVARQASVDGRMLALPRQQIAVLELLLRRLGQVVPRTVLEDKLYGFGREPESNPVPVHVHNLRKRLQATGAAARIHTVRGVGYLLIEP